MGEYQIILRVLDNLASRKDNDPFPIKFYDGEILKVTALTKAKFLLISGKPIGEQIARGGPFVMNTKQEILQAIDDYHNGNFVKQ